MDKKKFKLTAIRGSNPFFRIWDLILMVFSIIALVDDILVLVIKNLSMFWKFKLLIECVFYFDILLNFFRGPVDLDKDDSCCSVALNYLL